MLVNESNKSSPHTSVTESYETPEGPMNSTENDINDLTADISNDR